MSAEIAGLKGEFYEQTSCFDACALLAVKSVLKAEEAAGETLTRNDFASAVANLAMSHLRDLDMAVYMPGSQWPEQARSPEDFAEALQATRISTEGAGDYA